MTACVTKQRLDDQVGSGYVLQDGFRCHVRMQYQLECHLVGIVPTAMNRHGQILFSMQIWANVMPNNVRKWPKILSRVVFIFKY